MRLDDVTDRCVVSETDGLAVPSFEPELDGARPAAMRGWPLSRRERLALADRLGL